jgi:hypothetical protein
MSNYLQEIENAYSRGRGKLSRLNPLDWNLAATWENSGIPLRIVLSAMEIVFDNYRQKKRPGLINSLSYFTQEVEKQFTEWQAGQIGKSETGDHAAEPSADFICRSCKYYENHSDDFYKGLCLNNQIPKNIIYDARTICNPECEDERPEYYQFFQIKNTHQDQV